MGPPTRTAKAAARSTRQPSLSRLRRLLHLNDLNQSPLTGPLCSLPPPPDLLFQLSLRSNQVYHARFALNVLYFFIQDFPSTYPPHVFIYSLNHECWGSSCRGAMETNPTSIHEDAVLIPGLAQWVRIQRCHELWCRLQTLLRSHIAVAGRRPAATAPVLALAWELPCAAGAALKSKNNNNNNECLLCVRRCAWLWDAMVSYTATLSRSSRSSEGGRHE